jgi:hypothetical protein
MSFSFSKNAKAEGAFHSLGFGTATYGDLAG